MRIFRWGLRWLLCCVGVLVTACTQAGSPTQTADPDHLTPIDSFSPTVSATLTSPPSRETPATSRLVTNEPLPPLQASTPRCFATLADSVICLGTLRNLSERPYYVFQATVKLYEQLGTSQILLDEQPLAAALDIVPPGVRIPYRLIFPDTRRPVTTLMTQLERLTEEIVAFNEDILILPEIEQLTVRWRGNDYQVMGMLRNTTEDTLTTIRIVVTLFDDAEVVTGFRVLHIENALAAGESQWFSVVVAPLDGREAAEVQAVAQGIRRATVP